MSSPTIENYRFGQIVIDGQTHDKDVIILPNNVLDGWWRQEGHLLHPADLEAVFEAKPKTLVVGQGAYGRMDIARETREVLEAADIELIAQPTAEAVQTYNSLRAQGKIVAALHLTC